MLTYEAVRYWCRKFGQAYANQLRRRRPRPGDKWHLDEVFLDWEATFREWYPGSVPLPSKWRHDRPKLNALR
jgi:hypothetical protein